MTHTVEPTTTKPTAEASPNAPSASQADLTVCGQPDGLDTRGKPFSGTFDALIHGSQQNMTVGELRTEVLALTTIGAPAGSTDGRKAIDSASFEVRQAMTHLVKDAEDLYLKIAGDPPPDELQNVLMSFTEAIGACKKAGYLVSWAKAIPQ